MIVIATRGHCEKVFNVVTPAQDFRLGTFNSFVNSLCLDNPYATLFRGTIIAVFNFWMYYTRPTAVHLNYISPWDSEQCLVILYMLHVNRFVKRQRPENQLSTSSDITCREKSLHTHLTQHMFHTLSICHSSSYVSMCEIAWVITLNRTTTSQRNSVPQSHTVR